MLAQTYNWPVDSLLRHVSGEDVVDGTLGPRLRGVKSDFAIRQLALPKGLKNFGDHRILSRNDQLDVLFAKLAGENGGPNTKSRFW